MVAARGLISSPRNWCGSTVWLSSSSRYWLSPNSCEQVEHLAFEALQVLHGDVEEVAGAAGRVEDAQVAELVVEVLDRLDGGVAVAGDVVGERRGLDVVPALAQRLDHRRHDQALDPAPGRELGAELAPLARIERLFEEGAEDRGLDVAPVGLGGVDQEAEKLGLERQRRRVPGTGRR